MKEFWFKHHLNISGICLSGFALCCSFSISLTQVFLGLSLAVLLIDLIFFIRLKSKIQNSETGIIHPVSGYMERFLGHWSSYKVLPVFYYLAAWVALRILHLGLTSNFLEELFFLREIWLLLILPLILFRLPDSKWFHIFWVCLIAGAFSTGLYNFVRHFWLNLSLGFYRIGGFGDTMHSLSYTGIMGLLFFLVLGGTIYFWSEKQKKLAIFSSLGGVFIFIGFFLSQSRGGYIAFGLTLILFFILVLRRKFIFVLPLLLFSMGWAYQNVPGISEKFAEAKEELFRNLKSGRNCGTIQDRIHFWEIGLQIWSRHPLLGVGNADYKKAYRTHRPKNLCGTAGGESIPHLHNDFLNTAVLFGSVGLSIFLMFYLIPFLSLADGLRTEPENKKKLFMIGAASSVGMMFFLGLSQCHFTDEEVQTVFWICMGIFFRKGKSE